MIVILSFLYLVCTMIIGLPVAHARDVTVGQTGSGKLLSKAELNQQITDASTGTITAMIPNDDGTVAIGQQQHQQHQQQPVTCNEIMAKAVVTASEEKERALKQRDDALLEVQKANEKIADLNVKIDAVLLESKNATIEYEAIRLMTNRLVDEVKVKAKEEMEIKDEENAKVVKSIKEEMEALRDSLVQEMEQIKAVAQTQVDTAKENANKSIAAMKEVLESTQAKAQEDIESIKAQAHIDIDAIKAEFTLKEQKMIEDTSGAMEQIQSGADKEKEMLKQKIEDLETSMEELKNSTTVQIQAVKEESAMRLHEAYAEAHKVETDAMFKADEIERNILAQMEQVKTEASKVVEDTYKSAHKEYEKIRNESAEELDKMKKECTKLLDGKEMELVKLKDASILRQKEMQSVIDTLKQEIETFNNTSLSLYGQLSETKRELDYWKAIVDNPTYVNTTLIWEDAWFYTSKTAIETKVKFQQSLIALEKKVVHSFKQGVAKSQQMLKTGVAKAKQAVQPRLDWLREFCNEMCKDVVDNTIKPFHQRHIAPFHHKHIVPFHQKHIAPFHQKHIVPFHQKHIVPFHQKHIVPFHQKHIVPMVELAIEQFHTHVMPQLETFRDRVMAYVQKLSKDTKITLQKLRIETEKKQKEIFVTVCSAVERKSGALLIYLKENAENKTPIFIFSFLERIEDDASNDVTVAIKVVVILIIFTLRYTLLALVWNLALVVLFLIRYFVALPFRVVWFFSPLRLLFVKGKVGSVKAVDDNDKSGEESTNDNKIKAVKTEDNGSAGNGHNSFMLKTQ